MMDKALKREYAVAGILHSRAELKGYFPFSLTPNFSWVSRLAWLFNRFNGFSNVSVIVRAGVAQGFEFFITAGVIARLQ